MKGKKVLTFVVCLALTLLVGFSSSLFSGNVKAQYNAMAMPPLSPPDWIFGVMWTVLYIFMGISLYLVLSADVSFGRKTPALILFVLQLVANFAWSIIFFRADALWGAFAVILLLDLLVIGTITAFWRIRKIAAVLLVPYLCWILFASYLNVGFAVLN